jgi:hypothetical protein
MTSVVHTQMISTKPRIGKMTCNNRMLLQRCSSLSRLDHTHYSGLLDLLDTFAGAPRE